MKNNRLKIAGLMFSFILMLQSAGISVKAQEASPSAEPSPLPDMLTAMLGDENIYTQRVSGQEQGLNDVVLKENDRTYVSYIFAEDVKYTDSNGEIKDKDTTLINENGVYRQKSNNIQSYLPTHVTSGVVMEAGGYEIKFTPSAAQNVVIQPISVTNNGYGENYAQYNRVFGENTALRYIPQYSGLKEEIILNSYTGQREFTFIYETSGLAFSESNGEITLTDPLTQEVIFTFPKLVAYDSNKVTVDCSWSIQTVKDSAIYLFTVTVPESFLTSEATAYPVYVDPTANFRAYSSSTFIDTYIASNNSAIYGNEGTLYTGRYNNGTAKALFSFPGIINNTYYQNLFTSGEYITQMKLGVWLSGSSINDFADSMTVSAKGIKTSWQENSATYASVNPYIEATALDTLEVSPWLGTDAHGDNQGQDNWFLFDVTAVAKDMYGVGREPGEAQQYFGVALESSSAIDYFACKSSELQTYSPIMTLRYSLNPVYNSQNPAIVSGATYAIVNSYDSYAITPDISDSKYILSWCQTTGTISENQQFKALYRGDGRYVLQSVKYPSTYIGVGSDGTAENNVLRELSADDPMAHWYLAAPAQGSRTVQLINAGDPFKQANTSGGLSQGSNITYSENEYMSSWIFVLVSEPEYYLFSQKDPTQGTAWSADGLDSMYASPSSSVDLKNRIYDAGCHVASLAMILRKHQSVTKANSDDFRTPHITETAPLYADPFTVAVANCTPKDISWLTLEKTSADPLRYQLKNPETSSYISEDPVYISYANIESVFSVEIETDKKMYTGSDSAVTPKATLEIVKELTNLLAEHPEGIIVRMRNSTTNASEAHSLVFFKSDYDESKEYESELDYAKLFTCYDPAQEGCSNSEYRKMTDCVVTFDKTYSYINICSGDNSSDRGFNRMGKISYIK